ncbi:MAG: winged helix-turn-helix domain-containing protein [Myxococcota bacterium]
MTAVADRVAVELGVIDLATRSLGRTRLTPVEARLLAWLAVRPDVVVDRDTLLREVWGYPEGAASRTVFATIERLRRKIERDPHHPRHLVTIGRSGYAWRPLRTEVAVGALPRSADGFVGRADEIARVRALLGRGPVTLRGSAGIGKTRLALELARIERADRTGGVWFCDLSGDRTLADVFHTLSTALALPLGGDDPVRYVERVARVLRSRGPALVVFDNAESVLGPLGEVIRTWPAPRPALLSTSRRALGVDGEQEVVVEPLSLAPGAGGSDAARLFVERARERREPRERWRDHPPTGDELAAIEQIVTALDGWPLAIELAARWTRLLDPIELRSRLEGSRLALRAGPEDERPPRHHTLEAALRWSWDDLDPGDRAALAACSVFRGTFDAAAVEAVIPSEGDALERVDGLVSASLVRTEDRDELRRLSLLGAIRRFASARLAESPELERRVREAHAAYYGRLGGGGHQRALAVSSRRRDWDRLRLELGNLEAAVEHGRPDDAGLAAIAAATVLRIAGPSDRQHEPLEPRGSASRTQR